MLGADRATRAKLAEELHETERQADDSTATLLRRLDETFVTPFDRRDLYALATGLDDCMDAIDEAADLIVLYKVGELPSEVGSVVGALSRCADLTANAVGRLRDMRGLRDHREEVVQLVDRARRTYRHLLADLLDDGQDPLTVIKIKSTLDALDAAASSFRRLADVVESLVLQES